MSDIKVNDERKTLVETEFSEFDAKESWALVLMVIIPLRCLFVLILSFLDVDYYLISYSWPPLCGCYV